MLFNRDNKGKEEMKSILGFIFATNSFDNLRTDIILAEDDLRMLIGSDLIEAIDTYYHSADFNQVDEQDTHRQVLNELVRRIQQPLAFYAYRNYACHADLTHSDKGRQIHVSETEKPAFEWMIERDDQSMLAKAHKLTDRLLAYLEENKEDSLIQEKWTNTDVYRLTRELFINSAKEFEEVFPIEGSRRFFLKIVPFIREAEQNQIISVLGKDLFAELKDVILSGENTNDQGELIRLIRIPLALFTMVTAIKRLSVEVLPEGIFQNFIPGVQTLRAKNPSPMEFKAELAGHLETEARRSLIVLQENISRRKALAEGSTYTGQNLLRSNSSDNKYFRV
ncbi:MAG: hypothetical protein NTU44_04570 [Bacteroidetes bacterium]|nr:hypothetical protein [Bacteroidota bacterium]